MATEFKLVRGGTTLSLQAAKAGGWRHVNWIPATGITVQGGHIPLVRETIPLQVEGSNHNTLATHVQAMAAMEVWAVQYKGDRTEENPVFLHAKMASETGERRAFVDSIEMGPRTPVLDATGFPVANMLKCTLTVVRGPWERQSARNSPEERLTASASTTYDPTSAGVVVGAYDLAGDHPARIALMEWSLGVAGDQMGRIWAGMRSAGKRGTLANFINIWALDDGTLNADDVTDVGAYVQVAPNVLTWDNTWQKALVIKLSDVTANEKDNYGLFTWLLRAQVASGTWEAQLRWGYVGMSDDEHIRGSIVELTNTSWDFTEQGIKPIPLRNLHAFDTTLLSENLDAPYRIQVWARRTAGAGNLHLDSLSPVPQDEGFLKVWGFNLTTAGSPNDDSLYFGEGPDGQTHVQTSEYGSGLGEFPPFVAENFRIPPGDSRIIMVIARLTESDATDQFWVNPLDTGRYYERWELLRGSE